MVFDKLVYHESAGPDPGSELTVDFGGIGELMMRSGLRGEVNWRRLTRPVLDVLRMKLDACDFEAWQNDYSAPAPDGFGWGLELFDGATTVKLIRGHNAVPEQWTAFRSILELCGALAENRSKRSVRTGIGFIAQPVRMAGDTRPGEE